MTTTLITGANQGLGRETARRLIAAGHDVWLGARDPEAGRAAAGELGGRFLALDVTDDASVAAARRAIEAAGGLDVLVNNAGISGGALRPVLETDFGAMAAIYATNVIGVARVTLAFADLLSRSRSPVVVNVSSYLGSLARTAEPGTGSHAADGLDYPASKAALNLLTLKLAHALPRFRVNAVAPGFTATALNGFTGPRTVEQSAEVIVRAALLGADGPTGTFFDESGPVAW
jgi:NAD(P)-dependent dehydrogenase (short-subunit alcohol dehydrogenase family)